MNWKALWKNSSETSQERQSEEETAAEQVHRTGGTGGREAEEGRGADSNRAPAVCALRGGNGREESRAAEGPGHRSRELWGAAPDIEHSALSNTALPADGDRRGRRAPSTVCSAGLIAPIHCV